MDYYQKVVSHLLDSKPGQRYKKIKQMTGKMQTGQDFGYDEPNKQNADCLNTHLAAILQSLPPLNLEDFPHSSPDLMDFPIITEFQVRLKFMKLKRTSITPLSIPVALIKAFPEFLSTRLTLIFNKIAMSGQYPRNWKKGFITSIPKKGAPCDFTGLWPIMMTSIFSKIYERFIAGWLKTFILHKIDPQQYGNILKSSTSI